MRTVIMAKMLLVAMLLAACATLPEPSPNASSQQVLFVCEHGNVKSLMAASYFNQIAAERQLPFRAVSRGVAPDSTSVPAPIFAGLRAEGIDVSGFQPLALTPADALASRYVIAIGTQLPSSAQSAAASTEQWSDVPAASVNYAAARDSLRAHVQDLVDRLTRTESK